MSAPPAPPKLSPPRVEPDPFSATFEAYLADFQTTVRICPVCRRDNRHGELPAIHYAPANVPTADRGYCTGTPITVVLVPEASEITTRRHP